MIVVGPALLLHVVLSGEPAAVTADPVDQVIATAQAQAASGAFDDALATVRAGRRAHDDPALVFVQAQLERMRGDCAAALRLYREFIATAPVADDRAAAEAHVRACEAQAARAPMPAVVEPRATTPTPAPASVPPPVVVAADVPPPRPARPRPAALDGSQIALWSLSAVALVAGIATISTAYADSARRYRGGPTLDQYLDRERRARVLAGVGIGGLAIGGALLTAAVVRHVVLVRRRARRSGAVASFGVRR